MKKNYFLILIGIWLFVSCENKQTIEGLWIVKSVMVGKEEMTPNGRWMRFNSDFTQQSGNGWLQHSFGSWSFNHETNQLSIINFNGLNDPNDPFQVTISKNEMTWTRTEDGDSIKVWLMRSEKLPETYRDNLLGLWKLEKAVGKGGIFSESVNSNDFIFFRWDNRFVIGNESNRYSGIYQVNGHKPLVSLIPSDEKIKQNTWDIHFDSDKITLSMLNSDNTITRTFIRVHDFPQ